MTIEVQWFLVSESSSCLIRIYSIYRLPVTVREKWSQLHFIVWFRFQYFVDFQDVVLGPGQTSNFT